VLAALPEAARMRAVDGLPVYFERRQRQWFYQVFHLVRLMERQWPHQRKPYPGRATIGRLAPKWVGVSLYTSVYETQPAWKRALAFILPGIFFMGLGWYIGTLPSVGPTYNYNFPQYQVPMPTTTPYLDSLVTLPYLHMLDSLQRQAEQQIPADSLVPDTSR
ncbi:MAG: hypothetical protein D6722_25415, partial [Bacteroidetes bacterium]